MNTLSYDTTKTMSGLDAPLDWHVVERREDGIMWQRLRGEAIKVIESTAIQSDGKTWLHVSVSKVKKRMPTYDDIQMARKLFIGEHRECYQVFPPSERYVNVNPVLHLFCCLSEPEGVLPQFEGKITIEGRKVTSV